jgi:hypothetical protein
MAPLGGCWVCFVGKRGSLPLEDGEDQFRAGGVPRAIPGVRYNKTDPSSIMTAARAWGAAVIVEPDYDGRENRGNDHLQERRDAG